VWDQWPAAARQTEPKGRSPAARRRQTNSLSHRQMDLAPTGVDRPYGHTYIAVAAGQDPSGAQTRL